jgi:hypothetical protein
MYHYVKVHILLSIDIIKIRPIPSYNTVELVKQSNFIIYKLFYIEQREISWNLYISTALGLCLDSCNTNKWFHESYKKQDTIKSHQAWIWKLSSKPLKGS